MLNKTIIFTALVALVIFNSCKKNETKSPIVTITSPVKNDSFPEDSIHIIFSIFDENLSQYKIIISNSLTKFILYKEEAAVDSNRIIIDKNIAVNILADTMANINILGIDASGNTGGSSVLFKIKN